MSNLTSLISSVFGWIVSFDWLTAGTTTAALLTAGYLGRSLISKWLNKALQSEVETLKSQLRISEKKLDDLGASAFSVIQHRQNLLAARQIKAVEELWEIVAQLSAAKQVTTIMLSMNIDALFEEAKTNNQLGEGICSNKRDVYRRFVSTNSKCNDTETIFI